MLSKLFRLGFLSFIANVLTKSGVFAVSIALSHKLSIDDYATYSLLYNLIMVLGTLSYKVRNMLRNHQLKVCAKEL